ncbi:unnamed protein product, partial [Darwinula stevensoni]
MLVVEGLVDRREVRVLGGRGGDGCISFLSLFANEKAGPDGGDGGNGGHVVFIASRDVSSLNHISGVLRGKEGEKGSSSDCHGQSASHTFVKVPVGTVVKEKTGQVVGDLEKEGTMYIASRGGSGGKGNHYFVEDTLQVPRFAQCGAEGEIRSLVLELKVIAQVGLVGFPNAGKSSLLRCISRARPKVAPYPFTTLGPHIGVLEFSDYSRITVADLPGLIEGAHKNRGLGHDFLRHVERCHCLLFILDLGCLDPCPLDQLHILKKELQLHDSNLMRKTQIVAANKIDLPGALFCPDILHLHILFPQEEFAELRKELGDDYMLFGVSALEGTNISVLAYLNNRDKTFKSHATINVLLGQGTEDPILFSIELDENKIPDFQDIGIIHIHQMRCISVPNP